VISAAIFAVLYSALYAGARYSDLLVRTHEAIDSTGLPSQSSNLIISGRGLLPFRVLGLASWWIFYPAHKFESWYRNRPAYFFRDSNHESLHSFYKAYPRDTGPRNKICEQGRAVNRWPFQLSSGRYRGSAFRHRACEKQCRPSAFTPIPCDSPFPPASDT
jgi:hypothetical protein